MTTTVVSPPTTEPGSPGDHLPGDRGRRALRESAPFLVLTYATALLLALALPGTVENPGPVSLLTLLTPAVVVGLLRLRSRRRHGPVDAFPLGLRRSGLRSWPVAVALPLVAIGGSLAAAAALGVVRFDGLLTSVAQAPIDIAVMTVLVLGEEIGWRSYLFPRLATVLPARRAALVTGFAQGLFHLPLLLLTPAYDGDGSRWIVVPGALVVITAAGSLFGWLRLRSGSLWPVAIAHATVNVCLLEAPVLVADDPDLAGHLTGEGGLFTVLTVLAVALWVLRRAPWSPRR
jgi:membrane protease YdiL (CAAX protease family)